MKKLKNISFVLFLVAASYYLYLTVSGLASLLTRFTDGYYMYRFYPLFTVAAYAAITALLILPAFCVFADRPVKTFSGLSVGWAACTVAVPILSAAYSIFNLIKYNAWSPLILTFLSLLLSVSVIALFFAALFTYLHGKMKKPGLLYGAAALYCSYRFISFVITTIQNINGYLNNPNMLSTFDLVKTCAGGFASALINSLAIVAAVLAAVYYRKKALLPPAESPEPSESSEPEQTDTQP